MKNLFATVRRGVVAEMRWLAVTFLFFLQLGCGFCAGLEPRADRWLAEGVFPEQLSKVAVVTNEFAMLRAEAVAEKLQIKCEGGTELAELKLITSADAPGHWPARDWRTIPMRRAGAGWLADAPVDSVDVPLVYFVAGVLNGRAVVSPLRLAQPRGLGMERPSRLFWAFVEGFEQGTEGWRASNGRLATNALARSGRAALAVKISAGQKSASLETTRLRGWLVQEHSAEGVAFWLRTTGGSGRAAFTLAADAFTTNQVLSRSRETFVITTNWTKARLPFESFPRAPLGGLDLLTLEFSAGPGTELLVDDVHLLGRWRENF